MKTSFSTAFRTPANFVERVNARFGQRTTLLTPLVCEPQLNFCGTFIPPPNLLPRIAHWREVLSAPGRYNEQQAILAGKVDYSEPTVTIPVQTLDYATATAMREAGDAPPVLSIGTVAVCLERSTLYVHKRADDAQNAPSMLHSFSGGYRVDTNSNHSLLVEGLREFGEETGLGIFTLDPASPPPRLALFHDKDYGALETCLLGVTLTTAQVDRLVPTSEGASYEITFDALPASLMDGRDRWTEGGKLEVLTWLALGAPPCMADTLFNSLQAIELFEKIIL